MFPSFRLLLLHVTSSSFQSPLPSSHLPFVVLISSIVSCDDDDVFLSTLTFCCLHSIHSTYSPSCDDHQSNYLLFLSINTYLLFSWLPPMHWSLSLVACLPHLCICILTLAFLHRSVWRSYSLLSCVSWGLSSIYFTLAVFDILYLVWASDHSDFSSAHYLLCHSCLMKCPYRYMSLRSLTRWSSVLPTVQTRQFFFHLLCDLNQGSLPPKPITLPTVLARLRCWCEE